MSPRLAVRSNTSRVALILVALAVSAVLFVALSDGGEDPTPTVDETVGSGTEAAQADGGDSGGGTAAHEDGSGQSNGKPAQAAEPTIPVIVVEGGQPLGGVAELNFKSGETIAFKVRSDSAEEVHFHGYELAQELPAGGSTTFEVAATIEGVFEVELHESLAQIAEVSVVP